MSSTKDKNYDAFPDQAGRETLHLGPENWVPPANPLDYDDIVKMSAKKDSVVEGITISGGREDCSDAVRGSNYTWRRVVFAPLGAGVLTIKGSIDGWLVDACLLAKHGKKRDIEVGQFDNYWFPGRPPTRNGMITRTLSEDGKPVRVQLWDAEEPLVTASNVKITKIPKFIWLPYFLVRYVYVRIIGLKTK
jgi:hypothetical protein